MSTDLIGDTQFTVECRRIIKLAPAVAAELGAPAVGTEHLLVAMLRIPSDAGLALARVDAGEEQVLLLLRGRPPAMSDDDALALLGIDGAAVRARIAATFGASALDGDLAWTDLASQVVLDAADGVSTQADEPPLVGTDRLFLALLDRHEGAAAEILHELGVDREQVVAWLERLQPVLRRFRDALWASPQHARYRAILHTYAGRSTDQPAPVRDALADLHLAHDHILEATIPRLAAGEDTDAVMAEYFRALGPAVEDAELAFAAAGVPIN
jgi:hypothetical protein